MDFELFLSFGLWSISSKRDKKKGKKKQEKKQKQFNFLIWNPKAYMDKNV